MGAALRPWFAQLPSSTAHIALWFMTDVNWAMALAEHRRGERDAAILVGSGVALWLGWVSGSVTGHLAGAALGDLRLYGRSEEHMSELQSLMRISYDDFCLKTHKNTIHDS